MNLFEASHQWATRPADERFWTLEELLAQTRTFHIDAVEAEVEVADLRIEALHNKAGDLDLFLRGNGPVAGFTHYSFGQICQTAGAPAKYLRNLPAELAAENLNHGLSKITEEGRRPRHVLFRKNGGLRAHAIVSPDYGRVWNDSIVERIIDLQEQGWRVPPARPSFVGDDRARPATQDDVLNSMAHSFLSVNVGDMIAPAGLYASDRDMFVFMVSEIPVEVPGLPPLFRGFFVSNSEVGDRSFRGMTFLMNHVCGNHIVWGAQNIMEVKVVHYGDEAAVSARAFAKLADQLNAYVESSTGEDARMLEAAKDQRIGDNREDTVQAVYSKMHRDLPLRRIEAAYDEAESHPEDGHNGPDTVLGMVQGITRLSQKGHYTNERDRLDRAAGKLPRINF